MREKISTEIITEFKISKEFADDGVSAQEFSELARTVDELIEKHPADHNFNPHSGVHFKLTRYGQKPDDFSYALISMTKDEEFEYLTEYIWSYEDSYVVNSKCQKNEDIWQEEQYRQFTKNDYGMLMSNLNLLKPGADAI